MRPNALPGMRYFPAVITEDIVLQIAAQASLLLLHRETDYYPKLRSIIA